MHGLKRLLYSCFRKRKKAICFRWRIGPVETSPSNKGEVKMSIVLKDTQRVSISVSPLDAKENPAKIDGAPSWTVVGPAIVTLAPSDDGLTCVATTTGALGTTQIAVSADADVGEGVQIISGLLDVEVVGGIAVNLSVTAGVPEEIPAETIPESTTTPAPATTPAPVTDDTPTV